MVGSRILLQSEALVRWRVPLGWGLGFLALYVAKPEPRLYVSGVLMAALGEALRLWASGTVDKNARLVREGPYALTRNPLYLGSLFVGVGFALATGRIFLVAIVLLLFLAVYVPVMKREAAHLQEAFPDAYRAYAREVPLFWPRLPRGGLPRGFRVERLKRNREHWTLLGAVVVAGFLGWKLL